MVTAFKTLTDEINRIIKLVASFSIAKHTRDKVPSGEMHFNNSSQAEQTIQTNINRKRPLVKGKDGRLYSKNPMNDYISQYADEFNGCLGCGSTDHHFSECSSRNDKVE